MSTINADKCEIKDLKRGLVDPEVEKLEFELEKVKAELTETNGQWSRMYDEKEKYKRLANQLLATIKTMQSIQEIEKELTC